MKVSKVGLVCCPNCDYLLPHDLSLEHCGNCGAVFPGDQGPVASSSMTESGNNDVSWNMRKDRISSVRTRNMVSSSSSIRETREFLADYGSRRGDAIRPNSAQSSRSEYCDYNIGTKQSRVSPDYDRVPSTHSSGNDTTDIANKLEEIRRQFEFLGSRQGTDLRDAEGKGSMTSGGSIASATGRQNVAAFANQDAGTSNYPLGSFYGYTEHLKDVNTLVGLSKVEGAENDQAELLGKLNELKDRLNRSYNAGQYPMETVRPTHDLYGAQEPSMPEGSNSSYNYNMQRPSRDKHDPGTLHSDQYLESFHHGQSYDVDMQDLHAHVTYDNLQHKDSYLPHRFKTPQYQSTNQYLPGAYQEHFNGKYTDFDQDPLISVPRETLFHQQGCRCSHCYSNNWKVNQEVPSSYKDYYQHGHRIIDDSTNSSLMNLAPPHPQDHQLHTRKLRDHSLENGAYVQQQKRRLITSLEGKRIVHPIAGSAPFITCPKCFQLLKLPKKLMLVENNQQTMCCGACSTILLLKLGRKGLVILVQEQFNQGSERDECSAERFSENIEVSSSSFDTGVTNSGSKDYDGSGYNYQLSDTESNFVRQEDNSNSAQMGHESYLSSSSFTEDEHHQDSATAQRDDLKSVEPPSKDNGPLPLQSVPLQEHHDNNSKTSIAEDGKGNKKSKRSYVGKLIHSLVSRNISVKDVSVATETDVSSEAYLNSGVTQDSIVEEIIEEEQPKINKRSESDSSRHGEDRVGKFSNSSQSLEDEELEVYVNGQLIPHNAVRKAEKVAGTIEPGDYWYDFQAGFWGVMGHPCLGIIAPYIKAFNYPMPECCAAGNTEVYVNGRELNHGDLDKLSSRGLPTTKHKSYIIKINGKVLDADTHEVLHNLGKLAPTVQRARRGFGMKIPKSLQQDQDD